MRRDYVNGRLKREEKRVKTARRVLIWGLTLALLAGIFGCPAGAADGLTFDPLDAGELVDGAWYKVKENCTVTGSTTQYYLKMSDATSSLTLDNVSIQPVAYQSALTDQGSDSAPLTLTLKGDNTLSAIQCPNTALTVSETGCLTITNEDAGIKTKSFTMESGTILPQTPEFRVSLTINPDMTAIVTGGSLNAYFGDAQPQCAVGDGKEVYLTEIQLVGAGAGKKIAANGVVTDPSVDYNFTGAQTDANGRLYFWLPEDTVITSIKAGSVTYTGTATTVQEQGEPYPFYPPADPLPYVVTKTSAGGAYSNTYDGLTLTAAGDYTVSSNGQVAAPITVSAATGNVNLTLNGVTTKIPENTARAALEITGGARVNLMISGNRDNALTGSTNHAGVECAGSLSVNAAKGATASLAVTGGVKAESVEIKGGVITADIDAATVLVSGGSVFGTVKGAISTEPMEITLAGAADKTPVTAAEITSGGKAYAYGLGGVHTTGGGKLRFYLPVGATLSSVTAGGAAYTGGERETVPEGGKSVTFHPPQYIAYKVENGSKTLLENTYRDGLTISGDGWYQVLPGVGVEIAKAPLILRCEKETRVDIYNLNVDTQARKLTSGQFHVARDAVQLFCHGKNYLADVEITHPSGDLSYGISIYPIDAGASLTIGRVSVNPQNIPAPAKAAGKDVSFVRLMEECSLTGSSGGGLFRIAKNDRNERLTHLSNAHFTMNGILPVLGSFTMDNAQITVGPRGLLLVPGGTRIEGTGRINVEGKLMGDPGVDVYYAVQTSAVGDHPLTVTGVTNGYAKAGDAVTVAITEPEHFLGWEIAPAVPGLDLTQNSVSFTADQAYAVTARYHLPVKDVKFEKPDYDVETGDSLRLAWTVSPKTATDKAVTFLSDRPDIAEVDEAGVVYGVASGTAIITVTTADGGFTDTCDVTVTDGAVRPLDVEIAAIQKGAVMKLKAPAGYEGAWSVKNESYAKIVKKNRLKGVELGETELIFTVGALTSKRPSLVQGKRLTVGESVSVGLAVRRKKELVASIGFGAKKLYLAPGEERTLAPTLKPKTALDTALYYQTSDARVVRVEAGKLIAMSKGKATVTGTASSFVKRKLSVVVTDELQGLTASEKKGKVAVGAFYQCLVAPNPLGLTDAPITWVTKNPQIASVDGDGLVQGLKKGKAKIIASSGKKKVAITVTVTEN